MTNPIIKPSAHRLTRRQRQWLWFVALWCGGLLGALLLAALTRGIVG